MGWLKVSLDDFPVDSVRMNMCHMENRHRRELEKLQTPTGLGTRFLAEANTSNEDMKRAHSLVSADPGLML